MTGMEIVEFHFSLINFVCLERKNKNSRLGKCCKNFLIQDLHEFMVLLSITFGFSTNTIYTNLVKVFEFSSFRVGFAKTVSRSFLLYVLDTNLFSTLLQIISLELTVCLYLRLH